MREAFDLTIQGIVQGVGFRPFVYRCAHECNVTGWVRNSAAGVTVHAEGEPAALDTFIMRVHDTAPAAAHIAEIQIDEAESEPCNGFEIRASQEGLEGKATLVSPDLATCSICEQELFDPANRRYRYPFINCTNCGPRFTIIDQLPYDRRHTSMAPFEMCAPCAAEYADPLNRRFHAQPDACWDCGPVVSFAFRQSNADGFETLSGALSSPLFPDASSAEYVIAKIGESRESRETCESRGSRESHAPQAPHALEDVSLTLDDGSVFHLDWGMTPQKSDVIFAQAVDLLKRGGILALKGLGGFHLVCDAENETAVANLRQRKQREGKPFAVMTSNVESVREFCQVGNDEEKLLSGSVRPIVLLPLLPETSLVAGVSDGLYELGVMLPYTPVQHLLMHDFAAAGGRILVMTSGNVHDEPIVTDDEEALRSLGGIADAVLGNNRAIRARYDDSVVRVLHFGSAGTALQFVRRARGYAPTPLALGDDFAAPADTCVCATGPEQKTTACLMREGDAFVTQHVGDMENALVNDAWFESVERYQELFALVPTLLACDKHPEYLTTKWARQQQTPRVEVQHHHAHIVSALAENGIAEAALGFAFDGTGYGVDGAIWGGEALLCNLSDFERFANFAYVPLPGGAAAVKQPLRMAYGVLWAYDLLDHPAAQAALAPLGALAQLLDRMIESGLNTPHTSSVGRLFDAASALLGICSQPSYEGEGAVLLEAAAVRALQRGVTDKVFDPRYTIAVQKNSATEASTAQDTSVLIFDAAPLFATLLDDLSKGISPDEIALHFHNAFVELILTASELCRAVYDISRIALSGGVFLNRYLMEQVVPLLVNKGFTVILNREVPPSDGCISLGQAVVACATTKAARAAEAKRAGDTSDKALLAADNE